MADTEQTLPPTPSDLKADRLATRAVAESWPILPAARGKVMNRLLTIALDPKVKPREAINAAKALISAGKSNLGAIIVEIKADEHEDIKTRLDALEERQGGPGVRSTWEENQP